jgi:hypothetical protein
MRTVVTHRLYGTLSYDDERDKVTVQKGDLAERLSWLMHHQDLLGEKGYYPNAFLRACEYAGICGAELDVKVSTEGKFPPPPGAEYSNPR